MDHKIIFQTLSQQEQKANSVTKTDEKYLSTAFCWGLPLLAPKFVCKLSIKFLTLVTPIVSDTYSQHTAYPVDEIFWPVLFA